MKRDCIIWVWFFVFGLSMQSVAQPGIEKGVEYFEEGSYEEASAFFKEYIDGNPRNAKAYFYMGRIYFEDEEFEKATNQFEQAAELDQTNGLYYMWLGHSFGRRAQNSSRIRQPFLASKCRQNYEKSVELDPENIEARESLIDFYLQAPGFMGGGRDKAESQAEAIFDIDPVAGYMARGRIHEYYEEEAKALENYWKSTEGYPQGMPPYYKLFNHFFTVQDYQSAAEIAKQQLSHNDTTAAIYINFGNALQRNNQFDEALDQYLKVLEMDSTAISAHYQIGRIAAVSGNHLELGKEHIQKFLQESVRYNEVTLAWAHIRLGAIYEHLKDPESAKAEYQKAIKVNPDNEEAKKSLAKLR